MLQCFKKMKQKSQKANDPYTLTKFMLLLTANGAEWRLQVARFKNTKNE